jgi:hypothetical protein
MAEFIFIYSSIHVQGCYSETGFRIGMDRILIVNGADITAIDLSLSALISWFMKLVIGF